jgi:O-antigen ligase
MTACVCLLLLGPAPVYAVALLPPGVQAPSHGVYAAEDEAGCCWTAPHADFLVQFPARADQVIVDFVIPPFAVGTKPTTVTLVSQGAAQRSCCYGAGEHQAVFHFRPDRQKARTLHVSLASSSHFVPAEKGLNQDRRVLAILLKHISSIDSTTGEMYVGGSPVSANLMLPRWRLIFDAVCLALAAAVLGFLAFRKTRYAWIAVVATAPFLFPVPVGGTTISVEKVVLILAAIILIAQRRLTFASLRGSGLWILVPLALVTAEMALSAAQAQFHGAALRETLKYAEYILVFIVVYSAYRADPDDEALATVLSWVICVVSLLALAQPLAEPVQRTIVQGHVVARVAGPLEGPNQLSAFLGLMLVALGAVARRRSGGLVAIFSLGVFALLLTLSRAGIAAFIFAMPMLFALKFWPRYRKIVLWSAAVTCAALFALTVLAAVTFPNASLDRVFGSSDAYSGGLGSRVALWHAALALWSQHPLLGVGPGNYELAVGRILPGVRTHPNGYFFQVLAEQGFLGALLFAGLVAVSLRFFLRNLGAGGAALAALLVVAVINFHQLFDGLLLYPKIGIEYWALLAIGCASVQRQRSTP